jgi:hypothetical protein
MTPELRTACEVIFQEHKIHPIKWKRDSFRGKISIGLSDMARDILVKKNIILLPNKSKKAFTQLNPDAAAADNFEEAEKMVGTKRPGSVNGSDYDAKTYIAEHVVGSPFKLTSPSQNGSSIAFTSEPRISQKWWLRPIFSYFVWPVCGALLGLLLAWLLDVIYTALFLRTK